MQFSTTPFLSGYMPERSIPRWGLLTGQVLTASVSTTDSAAKRFRLGVRTGSPCQFTCEAKGSSFQNPSAQLRI